MKKETLIKMLLIIGIAISAYLVYLHYAPEVLNSSFCNLNDYLSCSTVNKSAYATFLGIPVSIIGVLGLTIMLLITIFKIKHYQVYVLLMNFLALLFMLYLTIAEVFLIKAICILCITVAAIVLILFGVSLIEYWRYTLSFIKEIKIE